MDERFSLPVEPEFLVDTRLVHVAVELQDADGLVRSRPERQHVRELRRALALRAHVAPRAHERAEGVHPRERAVRRVEHDHVHSSRAQQLRVPAQHPGVGGGVVAERGFAPVVGLAKAPFGVLRTLRQGGILREELRVVEHRAFAPLVPCPVEDAHLLRARCGESGGGDAPSEIIHRVPGVREEVSRLGGRCRSADGNHHRTNCHKKISSNRIHWQIFLGADLWHLVMDGTNRRA